MLLTVVCPLPLQESEWGACVEAGSSEVLELYQGAKLELSVQVLTPLPLPSGAFAPSRWVLTPPLPLLSLMQGHAKTLTWHGARVHTAFTYVPPPGRQGSGRLGDAVSISVLEGEGRRASRVAAVAKRAGIASVGHQVPFFVTPSAAIAPPPPLDVTLHERTQWDAVVTWRPPKLTGANDSKVTCYALEVSTTGASGTYRAFEEIWQVLLPLPSGASAPPCK